MPIMRIDNIGSLWYAEVLNTDISYLLKEADVSAQQLAVAMQGGIEELTAGAPEIFEIPEGMEVDEVIQDLFAGADQLQLGTSLQTLWGTVGNEMLINDLEDAGYALAVFLTAVEAASKIAVRRIRRMATRRARSHCDDASKKRRAA